VRIGITYNLKTDLQTAWEASPVEDAAEEFDPPETIEAIQEVFSGEGHEVFLLGGDLTIVEKIDRLGIEFVFNLTEGFGGRSRESHIPAVLEMMGIAYSGSDPVGLGVTLDKSLAKRMAVSLGIPTPKYWILDRHCESVESAKERGGSNELPFPLFVKPLCEGSSKGIRRSSRVGDRGTLDKELARLYKDYPEAPVLVEEYIPGREFTVGVLGNDPPEMMGVMEIAFRDPAQGDFCYSLEVKRNWKEEVDYHFPAGLERGIRERIEEAALRLFKAFGLRDVARFDFRVNPQGRPYFLEANPLPGLSPESGDLVLLARKKGWSYRELILKITSAAMSRYPELNETETR